MAFAYAFYLIQFCLADAVRNIPDINQILTEEKPWKQVREGPNKGAKVDNEFPPLSGEKKNQNLGKTELHKNWNILSSEQAPAATTQTPAAAAQAPARSPGPSRLPVAHCQLPGPTPQPTKTHHNTQPVRKVP
ncbi:hypothetical protein DSO57_1031689 [Entomophthora muscae]|uniref:Uncharacterized protein n=1 Tax=Entomophthora muscae TaxID=34485 RepID=A0ACC2TC39_9FUNG|nr:hypothetical protein DSO57_1031689 [Entomophthora muscae]